MTIRFIRRKEVEEMTSLSRSRIYALMEAGDFPEAIKISSSSVAWIEHEVQEWIKNVISEYRTKTI